MIHVEIDRHIDAPIDDVFDRLTDIDAYPEWLSRSAIYTDSRFDPNAHEVGVGTVFHDRSTVGRLVGEITAFVPPRHIAFRQRLRRRGRTVFESRPEYRLEPQDGGSMVHHSGEAELASPLRFAEPIVYLLAQYERRRVVRALDASFG